MTTAVVAIPGDLGAQQYVWVRSQLNGHEYAVTAPMDWNAADAAARAVGAHLATIRSSAEQQWIETQFGTAENTWIGLNDVAQEGVFVWSSGETATYRNWCPNEPNGGTGGRPDEDFVHLAAFSGQCFGAWNDSPAPRMFRGLIERMPVAFDWQWDAPVAFTGASVASSSAYDPDRGVAVLTGGFPPTLATHEWDGRAWTSTPNVGLFGLLPITLCWDGSKVIGLTGGATYSWDGAQWSPLTTTSNPQASGIRMVYDEARDRVVAFGGSIVLAASDETWEWDGSDWTQLSPATVPEGRILHAMTYDSQRGEVLMFGGQQGLVAGLGQLGDTWAWDGTDWTQRLPVTLPQPRNGHTLTYVEDTGLAVLFGGSDGTSDLGDLWIWDGDDWVAAIGVTGSTVPRTQHTAFNFPGIAGQEVVTVGGIASGGFVTEAQALRSSRAFASYRPRGAGCAGSTQPRFSYDGLPALGRTFTLRGTDLPTYQAAVIWFGVFDRFFGSPLPYDLTWLGMPGCEMWSSADMSVAGVSDATGRFEVSWVIPFDAGLVGGYFNNQLIVRDPTANAIGVAMTSGGEGAFGR